MKQNRSPLGLLIFIVILGLGAAVAYATHRVEVNSEVIWIGIVTFVLALVVSSAVESMQLGGMAGLTALTMGLGKERTNGNKETELPA
jgi:hypothetical protein